MLWTNKSNFLPPTPSNSLSLLFLTKEPTPRFCSAALVLAKALVDLEASSPSENPVYHPLHGHMLPEIPLHLARQTMTRADFIEEYDHINIFTIDSRAMVRADSVPMMNAFREVCGQEGFEEHLEKTLERISAIESLGRTRELVVKDFVENKKYAIEKVEKGWMVGVKEEGEEGEEREEEKEGE